MHFYVHELHEVQLEKVGFQSTTEDRASFGRPDSDRKLIATTWGQVSITCSCIVVELPPFARSIVAFRRRRRQSVGAKLVA